MFIGVKFRGVDWALRRAVRWIIVGHFVFRRDDIGEDMLQLSVSLVDPACLYTIDPGRPGFASLRVSRLRLNLFAVLIVIGGLPRHPYKLFDIHRR